MENVVLMVRVMDMMLNVLWALGLLNVKVAVLLLRNVLRNQSTNLSVRRSQDSLRKFSRSLGGLVKTAHLTSLSGAVIAPTYLQYASALTASSASHMNRFDQALVLGCGDGSLIFQEYF
jgi:hypothetical protein